MTARTSPIEVSVGGRTLALTNLDKPLWPDGTTKGELIAYFHAIAPVLLPHLAGRPLTVTRFPDGIGGESFYQKNAPAYTPDWIRTFPVYSSDSDRMIHYIVAEEPATLVWLANQACLELHPWLSTVASPSQPDRAIIDLDPAEGATFDDAVLVARLVRQLLDELGLRGYPKLSGATGIHIYVPLHPRYAYQVTSAFVGVLGDTLARALPEKVTTERRVRNRTGRVYVDHLQNLPGKTIVAPYSPRPLPEAPVSMPIAWEELGKVRPSDFTVHNAVQRVQQVGDLFEPVLRDRQSIDSLLPAIETWRQSKRSAR